MTKKIMEYFGVAVELKKNQIAIAHSKYKKKDIVVEKDWSAASYIFEIAALTKEADIFIEGLSLESIQGDIITVELFKKFGVAAEQERNGVRISKMKNQHPSKFEADFIDHPDLVMTMSFLCAAKRIEGRFKNIQTLRIKETDRVEALKNLLNKLGCELIVEENSFILVPNQSAINPAAPLSVFNDHRLAMALAPLALSFGKVTIENPDVVKKSYPGYWDAMNNLGFMTQ